MSMGNNSIDFNGVSDNFLNLNNAVLLKGKSKQNSSRRSGDGSV
jgi:hypothetical protein